MMAGTWARRRSAISLGSRVKVTKGAAPDTRLFDQFDKLHGFPVVRVLEHVGEHREITIAPPSVAGEARLPKALQDLREHLRRTVLQRPQESKERIAAPRRV